MIISNLVGLEKDLDHITECDTFDMVSSLLLLFQLELPWEPLLKCFEVNI